MMELPFLEDYRAFHERCGLTLLPDRTQIEVSGADRVAIIHNLCTNDVRRLEVGQGCEAVFTNVQGKAVGYGYVLVEEDSVWLDTRSGWGAKLVEHFERYVIMEDAEFADRTGELGELLVAGPEAPALLAESFSSQAELQAFFVEDSAGEPLSHRRVDGISWRRVPWMNVPCFFLSAEPTRLEAVVDRLAAIGVRECAQAAAHCCRIEAGVPEYGLDVTDSNLPQELDRNDAAISFQKGCYLGQETVARIDALGQVNWLLRRLRFDGTSPPPHGETIEGAGKPRARICSSSVIPCDQPTPIALAYVRHGHHTPGTQLESPWGTAIVE